MTNLKFVTLRERPEMESIFWPTKPRVWREFMLHDVVTNPIWHYLADAFPDFTFYLLNEDDHPVAVGHSIPIRWDGTVADLPVGWNTAFLRGVEGFKNGVAPNTLSAIEASIQPEYTGQGISYQIVAGMKRQARKFGLKALIAPVRPSQKEQYPLTSMERYIRWRREDGLPFDAWIRVHLRSGAEIVKVAYPSMRIEEPVANWEKWTGLHFPESGEYVVPGALTPVQIDREANIGRYLEPNVWMHHPITTERLTHD